MDIQRARDILPHWTIGDTLFIGKKLYIYIHTHINKIKYIYI